jgi:hypothetical protein
MQRLAILCLSVILCATAPALGAEDAPARQANRPWWTGTHRPSSPAAATAATSSPLPSLAPVFGSGADQAWTVAGSYTIGREVELPFPARRQPGDDGPGWPVLTAGEGKDLVLDGRTRYPAGIEAQMMVRLAGKGSADIVLGRPADAVDAGKSKKSSEQGLRFRLSGSAATGKAHASVSQNGRPLDWKPQVANSFSYEPRAYIGYSPGWPEEFRTRIEHDMARLSAMEDRWMSVRVEIKKGMARFWLDDRAVAWKQDSALDPEGTLRLVLGAGVQLAGFTIRPLEENPGFLPIRLGGYLNGRSFVDAQGVDPASLPPADELVEVDGVPLRFPGLQYGCDHLDISQSYLRQGNMTGYIPSNIQRFVGAAMRDPARIQLRVPNGFYDALYLVAAAEDKPDTLPLVTAMFYRPSAGFAENFVSGVPLATISTTPADAKPLPVRLANGKSVNLWLIRIPLDPGRLSSLGDLDVVEIELTKQVRLFRSYPDPISYGWHQAGLPSSAHIYAATLAESPIEFSWDPDTFGHVWQAPSPVKYVATVTNRTAEAQQGKLTVTTRSYDGSEETRHEKAVTLSAPTRAKPVVSAKVVIPVPVKLYGYHDVVATLEIAGRTWTERRSFVRLAPDGRSPRWTGEGALFGYWSYHGGHHTPHGKQIGRLMMMAGARTGMRGLHGGEEPDFVREHFSPPQSGAWLMNRCNPKAWASRADFDPAERQKYQADVVESLRAEQESATPGFAPEQLYLGAEPHISARLSSGNVPEYWSEKPLELSEEEVQRRDLFMRLSQAAAEAARKHFPDKKILIPWGDPGFVWPLLRAGFPRNLIDGSGLDVPGFEKIPERQLYPDSVHRLYCLRKEYEKAGIADPLLQYCEGIFVPTEPGAVSWREQMDIYSRWALISMAYGVKRFYSGWFAFDCGSYYGAEHYGGCGIQRRIPYCDPKPAYAAYATLTEMLNEAEFDGWLPTGSLSAYALRFKHPKRGLIYALWTLRGDRPLSLTLSGEGTVAVTDSMNNTKTLRAKRGTISIAINPSVKYVSFPDDPLQITAIAAGAPNHADARPAADALPVADLGDGSWRFTDEHDKILETNHWGVMHYPGRLTASLADDAEQGKTLVSKLERQDGPHELMPWYNVLRPARPIMLSGAPARLGLWVKGASDWGRVIYVLRDANGERWTSIGSKNQFGCDDIHSWSQFCFDGWRYLTFELPGHAGWDVFRKHGATWWRGGDGGDEAGRDVVDLPLALEAIILEQRTHILYVNDVQRVASDTVALGKLYAEYETPSDAQPEAIRQSRLRMPLPSGAVELPSPIARMAREGVGQAVAITGLTPPLNQEDGTRMHVHFQETPSAKAYYLWVSAHADGSGAVNLTPKGLAQGQLVRGLRPGIKLYYWIVYRDTDGNMSLPSPVYEAVTVDNFKEK